MTEKSKPPSPDANLDELHAWAARADKAAARGIALNGAAGARAVAGAADGNGRATLPAVTTGSMPFPNAPARAERRAATGSGARGGSLLPKVLLAAGAGLAAYLVFSFVIGLLMTLLTIVGGVAVIYAAYRIGRRRGHRDEG